MSFELKILGSSSATPLHNRHQSAQSLNINNTYFLLDCGESAQMQLLKYRLKPNRIDHIFISHLHGDHYLGLVGLISTMHLYGRQNDLHLYGPPGLNEIITTQLRFSHTILNYKINFRELDTTNTELILDTETLTVTTIPLRHRIACAGFLFREKPKKRRIDKEKLPENIRLQQIAALKKGEDIYDEAGNHLYKNSDLTLPPRKSRSFAYCSDTIFDEDIIPFLKEIDLLYHESTFLHDMEQRAKETFHTTTIQAATIAEKANVDKLLIGHFSSRYTELEPLLSEARSIFPNTFLASEGETFSIPE